MALARKAKHSLFLALLIGMGAIGLYQAFKFGSASLNFYHVKNILAEWQLSANQQSEAQYFIAKSAIEDAIDYHPSNPLYVDIMGQIFEWGTIAGYEDRDHGLSSAKKYYLAATKLRPSWPVTWASLAMIKWRYQEFDDETLSYLENANRFGPLKPEVHIIFSEMGLALYNNNHPFLLQIRERVHLHLALGLRNINSREVVISAINNYELHTQVCRWLRNEPRSTLSLIQGCKKTTNETS